MTGMKMRRGREGDELCNVLEVRAGGIERRLERSDSNTADSTISDHPLLRSLPRPISPGFHKVYREELWFRGMRHHVRAR